MGVTSMCGAGCRVETDRAGRTDHVAHADSRTLPDHVPDDVKEDRWHRFMQVQAEISAARAEAQVGTVQDVIVDGADEEEPGIMIARTKADAPDVDAVVYLDNATHLKPGDIVSAKITGADDYDLYATPA